MSRIKSKNTNPEILIRRFLHNSGYRFRLHDKKLAGHPDIVLRKHKTVILIHGCFWHHHSNCQYASFPKNNSQYWRPKILRNIERDKENIKSLKKTGWRVIVVWTCKLKPQSQTTTLKTLLKKLKND